MELQPPRDNAIIRKTTPNPATLPITLMCILFLSEFSVREYRKKGFGTQSPFATKTEKREMAHPADAVPTVRR
jgi:hypothetical protein